MRYMFFLIFHARNVRRLINWFSPSDCELAVVQSPAWTRRYRTSALDPMDSPQESESPQAAVAAAQSNGQANGASPAEIQLSNAVAATLPPNGSPQAADASVQIEVSLGPPVQLHTEKDSTFTLASITSDRKSTRLNSSHT